MQLMTEQRRKPLPTARMNKNAGTETQATVWLICSKMEENGWHDQQLSPIIM